MLEQEREDGQAGHQKEADPRQACAELPELVVTEEMTHRRPGHETRNQTGS
jgi:hypothetical protein